MTVLVFDLDDTLYPESTFVQSGFLAVSSYIERQFGFPKEEVFSLMWTRFCTYGRDRAFDHMLRHYGIFSVKNVNQCVSVYRSHKPDIKLDPEAESCLARFSSHPLYIVTDGNKLVQHNKLEALELYEKVTRCYITHRYGLKHAKPSPYCFLKICEREHARPQDVIYVADNPNKDFVGIKPYGFVTVRLLKGAYRDAKMDPKFEADFQITSLAELDRQFLHKHRAKGD